MPCLLGRTCADPSWMVSRTEVGSSVLGWINHVRYGDTWGLRRAILKDVRL